MRNVVSVLYRVARSRGARLGFLAIMDQCLFSGTNFLTVVILGRYAETNELGIYALVFSLVTLAIGMQRAFLISPFVVVRARLDEERTKMLRGSILAATFIMGGMCSVLMLPAFALASPGLGLAMVIAMPAGLIRDFSRRMAIVDTRMQSALAIDTVIALLQLGSLWLVARATKPDAIQTLHICSAIWISVGLAGLVTQSRHFVVKAKSLRNDLSLIWPIGRWVGMSQLLSTIQVYVLPWVMAIAHSVELAGIYAACWTLVQVVSPAIEGLGNILGPVFSKSASKSAGGDLGQKVRVSTGVFALLMAMLMVLLVPFGQVLLTKIYGDKFGDYYSTLIVLGLASSLTYLGIPAGKALTQLGRERINFLISLASLTTTIAVAVLCLRTIGVSGAAWGLVAGGCVSTAAKWMMFQKIHDTLHSQVDSNS